MNPTVAAAEAEIAEWSCHDAGDGYVYYYNRRTELSTWTRPALWTLFNAPGTYDLQDGETEEMARAREAAEAAAAAPAPSEEDRDEVMAEAVAAAPLSDADKEEQARKIVAFRAALKEIGVTPFSQWDKTMPKLALDARYHALASPALRRQVFDHYVRNHGKMASKVQRGQDTPDHRAFADFLAGVERLSATTTLTTLPGLLKPPQRLRLKQLLRNLTVGDRQAVLEAALEPLKRAAQEAKEARLREGKAAFMRQLRETPGITQFSRWKQARRQLERDTRCKALPAAEAQAVFEQYCHALQFRPAPAVAPPAARPGENARAQFRRLLAARVSDPAATFEAAAAGPLAGAPELAAAVAGGFAEGDFRDFQRELREAAQAGLRALLTDMFGGDIPLDLTWTDVRPVLESDERFQRAAACDPEHVFHAHLARAKREAAAELEALLLQTPTLTAQTPKEGPELDRALEGVRRLPQYLRMACVPEERQAVVEGVISSK